MKMLWIAAGFAAGYVMGSKAGRERYEQIRQAASDFVHTPVVADVQVKAKKLAERGAEAIAVKTGLSSADDRTSDDRPADTVAMATPHARALK
jgi:hypothetical protein